MHSITHANRRKNFTRHNTTTQRDYWCCWLSESKHQVSVTIFKSHILTKHHFTDEPTSCWWLRVQACVVKMQAPCRSCPSVHKELRIIWCHFLAFIDLSRNAFWTFHWKYARKLEHVINFIIEIQSRWSHKSHSNIMLLMVINMKVVEIVKKSHDFEILLNILNLYRTRI